MVCCLSICLSVVQTQPLAHFHSNRGCLVLITGVCVDCVTASSSCPRPLVPTYQDTRVLMYPHSHVHGDGSPARNRNRIDVCFRFLFWLFVCFVFSFSREVLGASLLCFFYEACCGAEQARRWPLGRHRERPQESYLERPESLLSSLPAFFPCSGSGRSRLGFPASAS